MIPIKVIQTQIDVIFGKEQLLQRQINELAKERMELMRQRDQLSSNQLSDALIEDLREGLQ